MNQVKSYLASGVGFIFTIVQTREMFQIVSLMLTILATLVSILFTIYNWYYKAKEDGKITPEEVKELEKDIKEDINKLKEEKK